MPDSSTSSPFSTSSLPSTISSSTTSPASNSPPAVAPAVVSPPAVPPEDLSGVPAQHGLQRISGVTVLVCANQGPELRDERDVIDLIGDAMYSEAAWVAIPAGRLGDDFFRLRTRVAGEIVQKFANYRVGLAVLGDISRHTAGSSALRDFVREADRGGQLWFPSGVEDFRRRLATAFPRRS